MNEVIIGAPYEVTQELIDRFRISVVVQGTHIDHHPTIDDVDCYELPKRLGIFRYVDSGSDMTTEKIIDRIIDHRFALIFWWSYPKCFILGKVSELHAAI